MELPKMPTRAELTLVLVVASLTPTLLQEINGLGWLRQWMRNAKMKQPDIEELPEFEELFQKTIEAMPLEKRLAGLAPEQVLSAFVPEQRLAGLAPEQVLLALPLEMLRALPEEYLRSFPAEIQEQVRKRLQGATH